MNRWVKRGGTAVAGLALLAGAVVWVGTLWAERRMARQIDVKVVAVAPATAPEAIARGRYLYLSRGCADCHGADGGGRVFVDDGKGFLLAGPQVGPGAQSRTTGYRDEDWVRSIRHGVHPSGRPLMVMPSEDYNRLTDADLAALVGYLQQMPPAPGRPAVLALPLPMRVLYGYGAIPDAAARIDHRLPPQQPVPEGITVEHGRYVAHMCIGCHGAQLEGGKVPGGPPGWPAAARLVPGAGNVMATTYADAEPFVRLFATGKRPDGSPVAVMPFDALSKMSDTDVRALHLYLRRAGR